MTENEFILEDRISKIQQIAELYDLNYSCISFSGGKDSTILHYLIDIALPNNKIPRIFINTGIEYKDIVNYVKELQKKDNRIIIINQKNNIKKTLEQYGYPFKSKEHSKKVEQYQKQKKLTNYLDKYTNPEIKTKFKCPNNLLYQFTPDNKLKISAKCCDIIKKQTYNKYIKNKYKYIFTGMRKEEGGQRKTLKCITFNRYTHFNILVPITEEWENWFLEKYNIRLCDLYYPPYNFKRTGCKGCPYCIELQDELNILKQYLPNEYKQCEILWEPVYDEYRRIGYRLKDNPNQLTIFDFL